MPRKLLQPDVMHKDPESVKQVKTHQESRYGAQQDQHLQRDGPSKRGQWPQKAPPDKGDPPNDENDLSLLERVGDFIGP